MSPTRQIALMSLLNREAQTQDLDPKDQYFICVMVKDDDAGDVEIVHLGRCFNARSAYPREKHQEMIFDHRTR